MSTKRLFTDAELEAMGARTTDLIDVAIEEGRYKTAKRLNHRMYAEFSAMHDFFRDWITGLLSYIYETGGEQKLQLAMKQSLEASFRAMFESYERVDTKTRVHMLCMGLRGHLQPLKVTEDEEKVSIKMTPCGTGERLIQEGAYGPPKNFSIIRDPCFMTYRRADCPVYCAHEPILEMLAIEWSEYPLWVVYPPEDRWGGCCFCIYKDPESIPEKVYHRIGKKNPSREFKEYK